MTQRNVILATAIANTARGRLEAPAREPMPEVRKPQEPDPFAGGPNGNRAERRAEGHRYGHRGSKREPPPKAQRKAARKREKAGRKAARKGKAR